MSQALLRLFSGVAAAGFGASLIVHVFALLGRESPFGSRAVLLHLGVFAVFVPAWIVSGRLKREFSNEILGGTPRWVKRGAAAVAVYAIANFVVFIIVTESSYPKGSGLEMPETIKLRGFSGHWMLFYYLSAATLYAASLRSESASGPTPFRRST